MTDTAETTDTMITTAPEPEFDGPVIREHLITLVPTAPYWYPNGGRDLVIMQLNVSYRYDPTVHADAPWVFIRAIAYCEDSDGWTRQIRWLSTSKPERIPRWLPKLIELHTPTYAPITT